MGEEAAAVAEQGNNKQATKGGAIKHEKHSHSRACAQSHCTSRLTPDPPQLCLAQRALVARSLHVALTLI